MFLFALSRKFLWRWVIVALMALLVLGFLAGSGLYGPRNLAVMVSRLGKLLPIYSVDTTGEKKVAISFDACWGAERTEKILEILDRYHVKTTFFLVNIWLEDYPEKARRIVEAGHEIGLHSTTHAHFNQLSEQQIVEELKQNADLITKVTGYQPRLFRPPFGEYSNKVIQTCEELGYQPIQWSIDSLDWKEGYTAETIYQRVTSRMEPGAIVLFHNDGKYTPQALPHILEWLHKEGFKVVPVSELLWKDNFYIDLNGVQHYKK